MSDHLTPEEAAQTLADLNNASTNTAKVAELTRLMKSVCANMFGTSPYDDE